MGARATALQCAFGSTRVVFDRRRRARLASSDLASSGRLTVPTWLAFVLFSTLTVLQQAREREPPNERSRLRLRRLANRWRSGKLMSKSARGARPLFCRDKNGVVLCVCVCDVNTGKSRAPWAI